MGSGHDSALPMAQSWAPCHVHIPTCPLELGKCFASGVTVVREWLELLCQHWASTTGTPAKFWVGVQNPCGQSKGSGQEDIPGLKGRGSGCSGYLCGRKLGVWAGRLPQTGRPNGPGQDEGEG